MSPHWYSDIHSRVFMPHRYTDDINHGYRKSFSLMGKVKSFIKGVGIALLNKTNGAETNFFFIHCT